MEGRGIEQKGKIKRKELMDMGHNVGGGGGQGGYKRDNWGWTGT